MSKEHNNEKIQLNKRKHWKSIIVILTLVICLAAISVTCILFVYKENARHVLKEAKLLQLAIKTVGVEYYALDKNIYDTNSLNGMADGVAEELASLSGCSGEVYILEWDVESLKASNYLYVKDGFIVSYVHKAGEDFWNVYKLSHVIVNK